MSQLDGKTFCVIRLGVWTLANDIWYVDHLLQPFWTAAAYIDNFIQQNITHLRKQRNSVDNADARHKYILHQWLKALMPYFVLKDFNSKKIFNYFAIIATRKHTYQQEDHCFGLLRGQYLLEKPSIYALPQLLVSPFYQQRERDPIQVLVDLNILALACFIEPHVYSQLASVCYSITTLYDIIPTVTWR